VRAEVTLLSKEHELSTPHDSIEQASLGSTVVITHRVHRGCEATYEAWLQEIGPRCRAAPGHLDLQIVMPLPGVTSTYSVIIRFDSAEHLNAWMGSEERQSLIRRVDGALTMGDSFYVREGLDFWFEPPHSPLPVPVRWKQVLITWLAIYPLVLGVPLIVSTLFGVLKVPQGLFQNTLFVSGVVVTLMVYLVMPRTTRLVAGWLHK
jgi:uncharacterized protein